MAFHAFCYSPSESGKICGETNDTVYKEKKAFEPISFNIGASNTINIGSMSGGGGAGKASFNGLVMTKKVDTATTELFKRLCEGTHIIDLNIDLQRAAGAAGSAGKPYLKFEFKMVMVEAINWGGSDGMDVPFEEVVFQYGAKKVSYLQQDSTGTHGDPKVFQWSRVTNEATLEVG